MPRFRPVATLLFLAGALVLPAAAAAADPVTLTQVPDTSTTFDNPANLAFAPGDSSRMFVVQRNGVVRVVKDGALLPTPFFDLSSSVESTPSGPTVQSENGMASIAFAPDYAASGLLYAFYTDKSLCQAGTIHCDDVMAELKRSSVDPDVAAPTGRQVLGVYHGVSSIHHGGEMAFGPDGRLWVATGDGGYSPFAQDPLSLSGKFLRLDPTAASPEAQVMAMGFRNPYRWSWYGSRIFVGDVGQSTQEEADVISPSATAPPNAEWPNCEGALDGPTAAGNCDPAGLANPVAPFVTYPHPPCAITGGPVVEDLALTTLRGRYLFADFCGTWIRSATVDGGGQSPGQGTGLALQKPVAFAQDASCAVYVASLAGGIYRIDSTDPGAPAHACPPTPPPPEGGAGPAGGAPGGGGSPVETVPPARLRLTGLSLSRVRVRRGVGVTLRLSLSATATVSVRLYRALAGHRRGSRCVTGTGKRHCVRYSNVIQRVRRLGAGRKAIALPRALGPGTYRLTVRANDAAGDAATSGALALRVLPAPRR